VSVISSSKLKSCTSGPGADADEYAVGVKTGLKRREEGLAGSPSPEDMVVPEVEFLELLTVFEGRIWLTEKTSSPKLSSRGGSVTAAARISAEVLGLRGIISRLKYLC
jgi:hypothetical protein